MDGTVTVQTAGLLVGLAWTIGMFTGALLKEIVDRYGKKPYKG